MENESKLQKAEIERINNDDCFARHIKIMIITLCVAIRTFYYCFHYVYS